MYHVAIFDVYDVSATHELFQYFERLTAGAKCMYNVANFYIRQLMTGLKKAPSDRTPNERDVIDKVTKYLPLINEKRRLSSEKRVAKGGKSLKPFRMPTASNPRVGYEFLVALFAMDDNPDYRAIYCHAAQDSKMQKFHATKRKIRQQPRSTIRDAGWKAAC